MSATLRRLPDIFPCSWASDWGEDDYGLWMGFEVEGVRQGLRWIPPGEFLMGSPDDEAERYDNEGPRHRVVFAEGFWLAETTCTQALWQAVMSENPSRFQGADWPGHLEHPVEQVSWDDVQSFITQLNERVPGLNTRLPSEAEWEYACRAGTETRYATGDEIGPEQAHFDQDLVSGSTLPAQRFEPNTWGLYQMHGNLWEWCEDCWHDNYQGAPGNGSPWLKAHGGDCEYRVVRGGSWHNPAWRLRSAYRYHGPRVGRSADLGFRLSRGHQAEP